MNRPPLLRLSLDELIIDSFAGGGGASLGIEMALGRSPDIAINHDAEALAMHAINHPNSLHLSMARSMRWSRPSSPNTTATPANAQDRRCRSRWRR